MPRCSTLFIALFVKLPKDLGHFLECQKLLLILKLPHKAGEFPSGPKHIGKCSSGNSFVREMHDQRMKRLENRA